MQFTDKRKKSNDISLIEGNSAKTAQGCWVDPRKKHRRGGLLVHYDVLVSFGSSPRRRW